MSWTLQLGTVHVPHALSHMPGVVVGALIAASVGLATQLIFEPIRRRGDRERETSSFERSVEHARRMELRVAAAKFAAAAVEEVDLAAAGQELRRRALSREGNLSDGASGFDAGRLDVLHTDLRTQYEGLLLLSSSVDTQKAARAILRVAWNEKEEGLGRQRKRERDASVAPAKYLRAALHDFTIQVRRELGMSSELAEEPTD